MVGPAEHRVADTRRAHFVVLAFLALEAAAILAVFILGAIRIAQASVGENGARPVGPFATVQETGAS